MIPPSKIPQRRPGAEISISKLTNPKPETLQPENPQSLKPSNPQTPWTLKPTNPQALKPLKPLKPLRPLNPQQLNSAAFSPHTGAPQSFVSFGQRGGPNRSTCGQRVQSAYRGSGSNITWLRFPGAPVQSPKPYALNPPTLNPSP